MSMYVEMNEYDVVTKYGGVCKVIDIKKYGLIKASIKQQ